jgi:hypothetical protein
VSTNIDGSIRGEASQNAMTGASGTPMARSAAISGITPQEQKGESAPASAPIAIIAAGAPVKARAISPSAPVAPAQPAIRTDSSQEGRDPDQRGQDELDRGAGLRRIDGQDQCQDRGRGEPDALCAPEGSPPPGRDGEDPGCV